MSDEVIVSSFTAPIRVVGYQRAHTDSHGRRRIKPEATRQCMHVIRLAASSERSARISRGAAHFVGEGREAHVALTLAYWSRKRPDIDNAVKTVLDALKGVVWDDDRQVTQMSVRLLDRKPDSLSVTVAIGAAVAKRGKAA